MTDLDTPQDQQTVLVTGATGFIGKHLVPRLTEAGHRVHIFSRSTGRDIMNREAYEPYLKDKIDAVIHLAGMTFIPDSWMHSDAFYAVNTLGTQRVLEFCHAANARMIFVSAYVYGVPEYLPIDEAHPVAPNNPYAHAKWLGEELCRFYARHKGVPAVIFRPFNLYGPGQDERFLFPTIFRQLRNRGEIVVRDEVPKRDYLHVADFVEACLLSLRLEKGIHLFNVGSGGSLSVREIIEVIRRHSEDEVRYVTLGERRPNEIMDTVADCAAIRRALGWTPKRSLDEFVKEELQCVSL